MKEITEAGIILSLESQLTSNKQFPDRSFKASAVLIPIIKEDSGWSLLFIRRSDTVNNHKGQVAFPGGMVEPEDDSLEMTAIRETCEEIGVCREQIHLLGRMEDTPAIVTGYLISPVIGRIDWPVPLTPSPEEVSRVFTIPLNVLSEENNWEEKPMAFPDGRMERVLFFQPYDGEILWGVTARITLKLLQILGLIPK